MEVTRVEQHSCIKIAVLRGKNAMEFHSELVEALGNNTLPYRTVARWVGFEILEKPFRSTLTYSIPTKPPATLSLGTLAAIFINEMSRYSKVDMRY
ncbi:hypothetical protein TNCV_74651 [Trichonephila clavipes]|nr:hypothetical protein TNCV_74651 [Trichonephila clavipes]